MHSMLLGIQYQAAFSDFAFTLLSRHKRKGREIEAWLAS